MIGCTGRGEQQAACLIEGRCYNSRPSNGGAVAQLGERLVRNEKVRSSILLGSTNSPYNSMIYALLLARPI